MGLSGAQHLQISQEYDAFIDAEVRCRDTEALFCRAGRLDSPVAVSLDELSSGGQYVARQVRSGRDLEVTGVDFIARIRFARVATAALCVVREDEFSRRGVLENFLRILLAHRVLGLGGMLLHSAGLVIDGRGFLFVGRSNAGKTTLTRKADAEGVQVLSDDINLILPASDRYAVHAVPFTGEFRRRVAAAPGSVPLAGILLLEKGSCLGLKGVGAAAAVSTLFAQSPFVNTNAEEASGLLDSLQRLVSVTPVARLTVAMEDRFSTIMNTVQEGLSDA